MASRQPAGDEVRGVAFPLVDGARSTTRTGKAVFADAARVVDERLATAIEREGDWRKAYPRHVRGLVEAELAAGEEVDRVPSAGLASLHERFVFVRDGEDLPLASALEAPDGELATAEIRGHRAPERQLTIPYRGQQLSGDGLHRQLDHWVATGTVEPSFAEAVRLVMDNPEWQDLSDRTIVVLGAGAEMGPLTSLSAWGAELALVDLPSPPVWERILATVRDGAGRARIPLRRPVTDDTDDGALASAAGADLTTETPELLRWLAAVDGPVTIGNYVYADGARNLRVSVAADALTVRLAERTDASLAMLLTPTDVYAAPEEAVLDAQQRYSRRGRTARTVRAASRGRAYAPNYEALLSTPGGHRYGVADCLVAQQGPNYALAKRMQRWRARLARDEGRVVSANVAPATTTRSVTKNRILAAAFAGAPRFDVQVFEPATSNSLMAALLVHDLRNPKAPGNPDVSLPHPLDLFAQQAGHGGMWRTAFAPRSVLPLAAVTGLATRR